ncbi:exopolysaccharide biosynthesis protein [uncultured Halovibrio sp.]|uniref:exopolysaccharide biosynthesis protein n=1 Tax=uncultured Halovibrio sp. TaxID=985049 RepID=UPI0025D90F53|nr:exopolysaccharide biosynthesis protein [uncultured Halovibrio sp.]
MSQSMGITDVLLRVREQTTTEQVPVDTLITALESRGFGPLLLAPALLALLPTGAIPGVPSVCGILIFLIAIQGSLGRRSPWVPRRLRELSIHRQNLIRAIDRAQPVTRRIDRLFSHRLSLLTHPWANSLIFLACAVSGLTMIPLELIPFAAAVPALAISLAAIGISTRDGLVIIGAGLAAAGALYLLVTNWPF